jgi:hypothetical protein
MVCPCLPALPYFGAFMFVYRSNFKGWSTNLQRSVLACLRCLASALLCLCTVPILRGGLQICSGLSLLAYVALLRRFYVSFQLQRMVLKFANIRICNRSNRQPTLICTRISDTGSIAKKFGTLLDLCVSSLRRGHANLLCIVPILTDDPRKESDCYVTHTFFKILTAHAGQDGCRNQHAIFATQHSFSAHTLQQNTYTLCNTTSILCNTTHKTHILCNTTLTLCITTLTF